MFDMITEHADETTWELAESAIMWKAVRKWLRIEEPDSYGEGNTHQCAW